MNFLESLFFSPEKYFIKTSKKMQEFVTNPMKAEGSVSSFVTYTKNHMTHIVERLRKEKEEFQIDDIEHENIIQTLEFMDSFVPYPKHKDIRLQNVRYIFAALIHTNLVDNEKLNNAPLHSAFLQIVLSSGTYLEERLRENINSNYEPYFQKLNDYYLILSGDHYKFEAIEELLSFVQEHIHFLLKDFLDPDDTNQSELFGFDPLKLSYILFQPRGYVPLILEFIRYCEQTRRRYLIRRATSFKERKDAYKELEMFEKAVIKLNQYEIKDSSAN